MVVWSQLNGIFNYFKYDLITLIAAEHIAWIAIKTLHHRRHLYIQYIFWVPIYFLHLWDAEVFISLVKEMDIASVSFGTYSTNNFNTGRRRIKGFLRSTPLASRDRQCQDTDTTRYQRKGR
ncbi:hypothetical protein ACJX0J_013834 [Zea mays]